MCMLKIDEKLKGIHLVTERRKGENIVKLSNIGVDIENSTPPV